jgi:phosphoribosylanthranilate isomerase
MTAIKICGVTRQEDAELAAALGADFVGFVLWPGSPRAATLDVVRRVSGSLPDAVTPVGVFVSPSVDDLKVAIHAGIRMAQVHGQMPAMDPSGWSVPVVPAMHLDDARLTDADSTELVLLDAHDPVAHGGTGRTIDWARAAIVARSRRVILAGGLTPENVGDAIKQVRPFGVDVASGVETAPGVKDPKKLRAFIAAAKESV